MSVVVWIFVGIVSGSIASMAAVGGERRDLMTNLVLGLFGAFVGGGAAHLIGSQVGVAGLSAWSASMSVVGAVVVLVAAHFITAHRSSWSR